MEFYDLKSRKKIDIPAGKVKKKKMERKTKSGTQTRYALLGDHDGRTLWKFVSEKDYKAADVPETK